MNNAVLVHMLFIKCVSKIMQSALVSSIPIAIIVNRGKLYVFYIDIYPLPAYVYHCTVCSYIHSLPNKLSYVQVSRVNYVLAISFLHYHKSKSTTKKKRSFHITKLVHCLNTLFEISASYYSS